MEKKAFALDECLAAMIPGMMIGAGLGGLFYGLKYGLQRQADYASTFRPYGIEVEAFDDNDVVAATFVKLLPKRSLDPKSFDDSIRFADQLLKLSVHLPADPQVYHSMWASGWYDDFIASTEQFKQNCRRILCAPNSIQQMEFHTVVKPSLKILRHRMRAYRQSILGRIDLALKHAAAARPAQRTPAPSKPTPASPPPTHAPTHASTNVHLNVPPPPHALQRVPTQMHLQVKPPL